MIANYKFIHTYYPNLYIELGYSTNMDERLPRNKRCRLDEPCDKQETKKTMVDYEDSLYKIILSIQDQTDTYLDAPLIVEGFKKLVEDHSEGMVNRCTMCKMDIGRHNPRQLCGKTYCLSE